jgi:carbonic anhydrase/acetyltransferase-like protein (isoleucine patch superfamily)
MVVMGVPGKIARAVKPQEYEYMAWLAGHYVEMAKRHCQGHILSAKDRL